VKLINTDGMAFIGPGSEWFWTALSGVILAITFLGIYRQLSIARSANAFEQNGKIANDWESERLTRHKLEILVALKDGVKPEDLPFSAATTIIDFFEDVAVLVRAGHVDRALFYQTLRGTCRVWWGILGPFTHRLRVSSDILEVGEGFEWLAGVMADMERKAGVSSDYVDEAHLAASLDGRIAATRGTIEVAEELRAVIVRPMSPAALAVSGALPAAQDAVAPA
jgi:hypothetical protein